jgi:hypothetical protein
VGLLRTLLLVVLAGGLAYKAWDSVNDTISISRNFYGVLSVYEQGSTPRTHRYMVNHGSTIHGLQFDDPGKRRWPTTYYGWDSGIGFPCGSSRRKSAADRCGRPGRGNDRSWGRKGDSIRFYEINPEMKRLADTRFTYLQRHAGRRFGRAGGRAHLARA